MSITAIVGILILLAAAFYFLFGKKDGAPVGEADAKRFARLLVTEIRLYEPQKVENGLKNNNLYEVLFEKIEEARKLYNKRILNSQFEPFFDEALVEILANGDRSRLGQKSASVN